MRPALVPSLIRRPFHIFYSSIVKFQSSSQITPLFCVPTTKRWIFSVNFRRLPRPWRLACLPIPARGQDFHSRQGNSTLVLLGNLRSEQLNRVIHFLVSEQLLQSKRRSFVSRSGFQCENCKKAYSTRDVYIDLTVTAGSSEYDEYRPLSTEMFRSPLVSFVYERGWRQNFASGGFPGPDEEFKMAQKFLEPVAGGLLVDASCGSGLFSRRFANCGLYSGVVALDFSENMLRQCYEFIKQDKALSTANLALVRANISRLPFKTGSVDAVHAGAALHCWPSASNAVAEISRVLRPGGVFVATTFVLPGILGSDIVKPLRQAMQATNTPGSLTEREMKDLCETCGLVDYSCIRRQSFVMISARKPE